MCTINKIRSRNRAYKMHSIGPIHFLHRQHKIKKHYESLLESLDKLWFVYMLVPWQHKLVPSCMIT